MASQGHRSSGGYEHDFQKFCVCWWGEQYYTIEKEAQGEKDGVRPDVTLRLKPKLTMKKKKDIKRHPIIYVEVQRDLKKDAWLVKTLEKYKNDTLAIIEVERFEDMSRDDAMKSISEIMENVSALPESRHDRKRIKEKCEFCGHWISLYSWNGHQKTCKKNPENKKKPRW